MSGPFQPGDVVVCVSNEPELSPVNPLGAVAIGSVHRVTWCGLAADRGREAFIPSVNLGEGSACMWARPAAWFRKIEEVLVNDNPFAFPCAEQRDLNGIGITEGAPGMTLRDYFAGQALVITADRPHSHGLGTIQPGSPMHPACAAKAAYAFADAMLAARKTGGVA